MKRTYLKKIFKILAAVDSVWVLEQVYRFAVNMTRGTEYEAKEPIKTRVYPMAMARPQPSG